MISDIDEALYLRSQNPDDAAAFEELLGRHWSPAVGLARALVSDSSLAEDVAQEAFLRVLESAKQGRAVKQFLPWFRQVVRNEAKKALRSRSRRRAREQVAARPELSLNSRSSEQTLKELTEGLPETLRTPIRLHFGLGLTHSEIAETLGWPQGTVSTRLRKGLQELRERLTRLGMGTAAASLLTLLPLALAEAGTSPPPSAAALMRRLPSSQAGLFATLGPLIVLVAALSSMAFVLPLDDSPRPRELAGKQSSAGPLTTKKQPKKNAVDTGAETDGKPAPLEAGEPARRFPGRPSWAQESGVFKGPTPMTRRPQFGRHDEVHTLLPWAQGTQLLSANPRGLKIWSAKDLSLIRECAWPELDKGDALFASHVFLSADGHRLIATGSAGWAVLKAQDLSLEKVVTRPRARVRCAVFDAQSSRLFERRNQSLQALSVPSFKAEPGPYGERVRAAALSPSGRFLATLEDSAKGFLEPLILRVWRTESGEMVAERRSTVAVVQSFEIRGERHRVKIQERHVPEQMAFSPDESVLHLAGQEKLVSRDALDLTVLSRPIDIAGGARAVLAHPDGQRVIVGEERGRVTVLDWRQREPLHRFSGHGFQVSTMALLDEQTLITTGLDKAVRLWDLGAYKARHRNEGHTEAVTELRLLSDGRVLSVGKDNQACLWDLEYGRVLSVLDGFARGQAVGLGSDAESLLLSFTGSSSGQLCRLDFKGRLLILSEDTLELGIAEHMSFSLNGQRIACKPDGKPVVVILNADKAVETRKAFAGETQILERLAAVTLSRRELRLMALSPEGRLLATVASGLKAPLEVFDTLTGRTLFKVSATKAPGFKVFRPQALRFSDDGRCLFVYQAGGTHCFDMETGARLWFRMGFRAKADGPGGLVLGLGPASEAERMDMRRHEGSSWIELVDRSTGQPVGSFDAKEAVSAVLVSPQGTVVTGHEDGALRFWPEALKEIFEKNKKAK